MRSVGSVGGQATAVVAGLLMKKSEVAKLLGCSDRQVENLVKSGRIPKPIQLGPNSPRWRRPELMQTLGLAENPGVML
jgi:excisionase family DNA binding protein